MYFQIIDLLSDIGGQISLWLGLSVVTCFELLEFSFGIINVCSKKCFGAKGSYKKARSVTPNEKEKSDSAQNLWYTK